jgi:hypothetical protein
VEPALVVLLLLLALALTLVLAKLRAVREHRSPRPERPAEARRRVSRVD